MKNTASLLLGSLFTLFLLITSSSYAQETNATSKRFGDYVVYYTVFNSTFIQADVASDLGLIRGNDRAIVNISIRKNANNTSEAVTAQVTGKTHDLMRDFPLSFTEIKEPNAVYYLAQFDHFNQETRHFFIDIQVPDRAEPLKLQFTQKLWHADK